MKTIVTHVSPDQDAVVAVWLVKRFFPGWQDAQVKFVPAGQTLNHLPPDGDKNVIHLDTGLGKFDHHQSGDPTICAATLVFNEIKRQKLVTKKTVLEALKRVARIALEVDHAGEKTWPDPTNDRYEFFLENILDGLKTKKNEYSNEKLVEFGISACDGIFWGMKQKLNASKILAEGLKFTTPWGRGVGVEATNDAVLNVGERQGFMVVVRKDPRRGNVRIYVHPAASDADLTPVYESVISRDPDSDWFLHASKKMLLNGSSKNPKMKPTKLTLEEIVQIIKKQSTN